jgi:hypothetical protein
MPVMQSRCPVTMRLRSQIARTCLGEMQLEPADVSAAVV